MNAKQAVINEIMAAMQNHVSRECMVILESVLISVMYKIEVVEKAPELATIDNTNEYIVNMFYAKKSGKLSEKTVEQYVRHVNALISLIQKPLIVMNEEDIEYFLEMYKKRGNSNVTVNNCKRYISAFFTWMRKVKLVRENPAENIDPYKETVKQIEHMEPEEWEQFKGGCSTTRDRALIEFLRCTAMRDGEVPEVRIRDVDWDAGKVTIYGNKSNRYRTVGIDRVAKSYLGEYLLERGVSKDSDEALFSSKLARKALERGGIYAVIKNIAKRANMSINVYPHLIRKTTATNIIKRGGSSEEVGEYLGHAERSTAGRYYAFKGEEHVMEIFRNRVAAI